MESSRRFSSGSPIFFGRRSGRTRPLRMATKFLLIFASVCLAGCGSTRAVFIGSEKRNEILRGAPGVKGKVYLWKGGEWILSKNEILYPEGAYISFLDDEEPEP